MENDSCLYLAVSVKGEFVAEDSSEALANITVPHGSFVPSNTLQTPVLYNLCVVNFKEECGSKPENLFLTSHIHPEGTLHVLLILKTYKQLTEHNLSTKYSI